MPIEHFMSTFGHMQVAMYNENWKTDEFTERGTNDGIWSYVITNP